MSPEAKDVLADAYTAQVLYASLHDDAPGDDGANQVSGVARKAITWNVTSAGVRTSDALHFTGIPSAHALTDVGLWTALTGGVFLDSMPNVDTASSTYDLTVRYTETGVEGTGTVTPEFATDLAAAYASAAAWASLHDANPGTTGDNELTAIPRVAVDWSSSGTGAQTGFIDFSSLPAGTSWTHVGLWTDETGGDFMDSQANGGSLPSGGDYSASVQHRHRYRASAEPPPIDPGDLKIVGMSSPTNVWSTRLAEVRPNAIRARRIFGDMTSTGHSQSSVIAQAIADDMIPVMSYKEPKIGTTPDIAGVIAGDYDSWLDAIGTYLAGLGTLVLAVFHHEPRGDMTVTQFRQASRKFYDHVASTNVKVGPILNGFLLTGSSAQQAEWSTYVDSDLMNDWDFLGMDTYQTGTSSAPGSTIPGDRIAPLMDWLDDQGHPDMPIVVGEYNGYTAAAITDSGDLFFACPNLWITCMWNSTATGAGITLTGARLTAFQDSKLDSRVLQ